MGHALKGCRTEGTEAEPAVLHGAQPLRGTVPASDTHQGVSNDLWQLLAVFTRLQLSPISLDTLAAGIALNIWAA